MLCFLHWAAVAQVLQQVQSEGQWVNLWLLQATCPDTKPRADTPKTPLNPSVGVSACVKWWMSRKRQALLGNSINLRERQTDQSRETEINHLTNRRRFTFLAWQWLEANNQTATLEWPQSSSLPVAKWPHQIPDLNATKHQSRGLNRRLASHQAEKICQEV